MASGNPSLLTGHFFPSGGVSVCHGAMSFCLGALTQVEPWGSVQTVTCWSCWHWSLSLCQGVPGTCCWKEVSAEALWLERVSGGFSGDVKDLHMNEEKETQFSTSVAEFWHFSSLWA